MKIAPSVLTALAVILALLVARECGRREGKHTALAAQRDRRDDSTVSRLVYEAAQTGQRMARERDSTGRVIRRLRAQIAPRDSALGAQRRTISPDSTVNSLLEGYAVRDSLIDVLTFGRQQDSLQILFWRAHAFRTDTVITQLQRARDAYRREASKPSYVISDIGGAALAGYGVAEKCSECVLVGAGVVLVPRLIGAVKRLF